MPKQKAATAAQFKKRRTQPQTITLPASGLDVIVKEVDVLDLLRAGGIPTHLSTYVWHEVTELTEGKTPEKITALLNERTETLGYVVAAMLVEPRCVMQDPGDDEITPEDIPYPDREALWTIACGLGRLADLARFPDEPGTGTVTPQGREDVRATPINAGGVGPDEMGGDPVR